MGILSQVGFDAAKQCPVPVFDGHVDLIYCMMRHSPTIRFSSLTEGPITPKMLQDGCIRLLAGALYCADTYNGPQTASLHLKSLYTFGQTMLEGLTQVTSSGELTEIYRNTDQPGILYLLENADALVDDPIGLWVGRGICAVGLTHAGENRIGSGNGVKNPTGFTTAGRRVIRELERNRIVIDVAHLSDPCFWELVDLFAGPLVSSHTGLRRFCNLPRNLSDEQVRIVMERGGLIGITVNPEMLALNGRAGISKVCEQVDSLVQHYGDAGVAIGTDFGGFDILSTGLENPGCLQALTAVMHERGYPLSAIQGIMGENWVRFYSDCFPATSREK